MLMTSQYEFVSKKSMLGQGWNELFLKYLIPMSSGMLKS
jgi:hypothetical protein